MRIMDMNTDPYGFSGCLYATGVMSAETVNSIWDCNESDAALLVNQFLEYSAAERITMLYSATLSQPKGGGLDIVFHG